MPDILRGGAARNCWPLSPPRTPGPGGVAQPVPCDRNLVVRGRPMVCQIGSAVLLQMKVHTALLHVLTRLRVSAADALHKTPH
jgi:hypothetical protein